MSPHAAPNATPRRPVPRALAAATLALILSAPFGCGPAVDDGPGGPGGETATRGRYEPRTEGPAEELARHIELLDRQFAEVNESTPSRARAALLAYTDAVARTAEAILDRPGLSPDLRDRAAATWLTVLRRRVEAEPKDLDRLLAAADAVREKFPRSTAATTAAFAKVDTLATLPETVLPDRDERFDRLSAAALELGQADPPYPDAPKILADLAPAAERLGRTERALAMYRLLAERFADDPAAVLARGNAHRLELLGQPVGEFRGPGLDGGTIDLEQFRGQVVLVDFWATWCAPCLAELPELRGLRERLGPRGFEILGVSVDRDLRDLRKFVRQRPPDWPLIAVVAGETADGGAADAPPAEPSEATPEGTAAGPAAATGPTELESRFGVTFVPLKLLVDREGRLVATGHTLDSVRPALEALFPGAQDAAADAPPGSPEASTASPPPRDAAPTP